MPPAKDLSSHSLKLIRSLPRINLSNISFIPGTMKMPRPRRSLKRSPTGYSHRGKARIGHEMKEVPFYKSFDREEYYKGLHFKRQYPPLTLLSLQKMIDLNRLDITKPIDLAALCKTGLYYFDPNQFHWGVQLQDEGADIFQAKINIEVQYATEPVIAAIERNGGTICTAFYNAQALYILRDPKKFFEKGISIPRRLIPPQDAILYYTSAANRGYLANPEDISKEMVVLAQKYGYKLPNIQEDPDYEMLTLRKDPRQIFYGLEPGWVINLRQKIILKPKTKELVEFCRS